MWSKTLTCTTGCETLTCTTGCEPSWYFLDDEADPDPMPFISNRSHHAGERLTNTHSGESCESSTHAKSDDGAELPLFIHADVGHGSALDRECGDAILHLSRPRDCGPMRTALSLEDHVAGERLINTTLRRSMARSQIASSESMCGRSAELSVPVPIYLSRTRSCSCSCSSSVDSTDSSAVILRAARTPSPLDNREMQDLVWHEIVSKRITKQLKKE